MMTLGLNAASRVAVVEDDEPLGRRLCDILALEGWTGRWFRRAELFIEAQPRHQFDAALVDLRLPGMSGLELLDALHAKTTTSQRPVLFMLTGDSRDTTLSEAFAKGAHDFLLKPVRAAELVARLAAALRRNRPLTAQEPLAERLNEASPPRSLLKVGAVRLEVKTQQAFLRGQPVPLTSREWALALFIFQHINQDLKRSLLQEEVFRLNPNVQTRTVDTHLSRLKTKLRLQPENGFYLRSLYGSGYRLEQLADETVN